MGLIIVAVVFLSAVSYHSIEEIHYLKSFFPSTFTVEGAKDAAIVEAVKIFIISVPVFLVVLVCMFYLKRKV